MARAKVKQRNTPRHIRLELTEGEVDFLLGLIGNVGGDPRNSPRKYADRIGHALTRVAGYHFTQTDAFQHSAGHVEFSDYNSAALPISARLKAFLGVAEQIPASPHLADAVDDARRMLAMINLGMAEDGPVEPVTPEEAKAWESMADVDQAEADADTIVFESPNTPEATRAVEALEALRAKLNARSDPMPRGR